MDFLLTYSDFQHLIAVKLCFFIFIILGLVGIFRNWKASYFLFILGACSGLAYYLLVREMGLMFWGLQGDEIFVSALYEMAAHGSLLSDFVYANLPPFYPPLFFWIFGLIGRLFSWNGIQIAKFAALLTFIFYPIVFYYLQKIFWQKEGKENKKAPGALAWFFSAVLLFLFVDYDAIILKPYEFISGSLMVLWTVFLLYTIYKKKFGVKQILYFGITGGLLFLTFYFWFFLAFIAIALFNLFYRRIKLREYTKFFVVGLIILLIATPYLIPLFKTYQVLGAENWQLGFTYIGRIKTFGPDFIFSLRGLAVLFGFTILVWHRKSLYIRSLLSLFIAPYIWQIVGLITILFFASPIQESKGFMYMHAPILALAAGFGIEKLWQINKKYFTEYKIKSIKIVILFLVAVSLIFGHFADEKAVIQTRQLARSPRVGVQELIDYLNGHDMYNTVTLHAGVTSLHSFLPINSFIYYNMHVSHPAAHFSSRLAFLEELSLLKDQSEAHNLIRENNFDRIDRLIFYNEDGDYYTLYFNVDDFPRGITDKTIKFSKKLFSEEFFDKVYESKQFIVFETKDL